MYLSMPITFDPTAYKFRPHLGQSYVLHGNKDYVNPDEPEIKVEWGIKCEQAAYCSWDVKSSSMVYYDGNSWNVTAGTTQFSLSGEQPDQSKSPMPLKLVFDPYTDQNWLFNNTGILGLSPTSAIWKYFFDQYDFVNDSVSVQFNLTTSSKNLLSDLYEESNANIFEGSKLQLTDNP